MAAEPAFEIPARPTRRYPGPGGLEYEGGTRFALEPASEPATPLRALVEAVLHAGPYRYGDFLELPMPLYLVRDDETGDVFRVSIWDGTVWLHVLPETESSGLRAFYDRLREETAATWRVRRETDE